MADFKGGSELDTHGGHEMVSLEQHQRLTVNLLHGKVLDIVAAARQVLDKVTDLLHVPLQRIVLGTGWLLAWRLLDNLLLLVDLRSEGGADKGAHHGLAAHSVTLKLLLRRLTDIAVAAVGVESSLLLLFLLVDGAGRSARSSLDRSSGVGLGGGGGRGVRGLGLLLL